MKLDFVFECEKVDNYYDEVVILSENDCKIKLKLSALKPAPLISFDPYVNFGFVPINTKKTVKVEFVNMGIVPVDLEIAVKNLNPELYVKPSRFLLEKNKSKTNVIFSYEPLNPTNFNDRVELQIHDPITFLTSSLGIIELSGTSIIQQVSVVFEQGGGPTTEINFGSIYFGLKKVCNAFLVNNGPREVEYNFLFYQGKKISEKDINKDDLIMTPLEEGKQMTERILSANPVSGSILPFSQIPIKFSCQTRLQENIKGWRKGIAEVKDKLGESSGITQDAQSEVYISTALIRFKENIALDDPNYTDNENSICDAVSVFMSAEAIKPNIILDKTEMNFWDCKVYEEKHIKLQLKNKNTDIPVDFSFTKAHSFTVKPANGIIEANQTTVVVVTFKPSNLGKFTNYIVLKYVNGLYEISLKMLGTCSGVLDQKSKVNKEIGIEGINENSIGKMYLSNDLSMNYTLTSASYDTKNYLKTSGSNNYQEYRMLKKTIQHLIKEGVNKDIIEGYKNKYYSFEKVQKNKGIANKVLPMHRQERIAERLKTEIDDNQNDSKSHFNIKAKKKIFITNDFENVDKVNLLMNEVKSDTLKFNVPDKNETLWVLKPIGKYQPEVDKNINLSANKISFIDYDRKKDTRPPTSARNSVERKQTKEVLTGYDLQKIHVQTNTFKFGEMFKGSEATQIFYITNNLNSCILFRLEVLLKDLNQSQPEKMIVEPGKTEAVYIKLVAGEPREINTVCLKYHINDNHTFNIKIECKIVHVSLKAPLPGATTRFDFKRERVEKDKTNVKSIQQLELVNDGNYVAKFKWDPVINKAFSIEPNQGEVPSKKKFIVNLLFDPKIAQANNQVAVELEEDLRCYLINGNPFIHKVSTWLPKSTVSLGKGDILDFGSVHIGVETMKEIILVNNQRSLTMWEIEKHSKNLIFTEKVGYIRDKRVVVGCTFLCLEQIPNYSEVVVIYIRGGPALHLTIKANIIIPMIRIEQEEFDFGQASSNEKRTLNLSFINESHMSAKIIIDFRAPDYKYFSLFLSKEYNGAMDGLIRLIDENPNVNNSYVSTIKEEKQQIITNTGSNQQLNKLLSQNKIKANTEEDQENNEEGMEIEENDEEDKNDRQDMRYFEIEVEGNTVLNFDFVFNRGTEITTKKIELKTNFTLRGYSDKLEGLVRDIKAEMIETKIDITPPGEIRFDKTFIFPKQLNHNKSTSTAPLKIYNVDNNPVKWMIDTAEMDTLGVFSCEPKFGTIPVNQEGSLVNKHPLSEITFTFKPKTKTIYESNFKIYLKEELSNGTETKVLAKTVKIVGEGTRPRIYFTVREVILPIVPLNVESKSVFKIKNDGFDILKINYKIECPQGTLPLEIKFLDGEQLGTKQELRVEVSMKSNKPLSFTAKLIFEDLEADMSTFIWVCGTTENEILTNYSYFENTGTPLQMKSDLEGNLNFIIQKDDKADNDDKKSNNSDDNVSASVTNKNNAKYQLKERMRKKNCNYLLEYLNYVFTNIAVVNKFPDSLASSKNNCEYLYDLVKFLSGVMPKCKLEKLDDDKKAFQMKQQFSDLLKFLQEHGGSLNTVLPEYLLEPILFKKFISSDQYSINVLSEKFDKKMTKRHLKLHTDSWILVTYQIIKLFYISRININTFKRAITHIYPTINSHNSHYQTEFEEVLKIGNSNVYSKSEMILLKWTQLCYDQVFYSTPKEIKSFGDDFKDGAPILAIFYSFFPKLE